MGTQWATGSWVIGSTADPGGSGARPSYQPRHARARRHQPLAAQYLPSQYSAGQRAGGQDLAGECAQDAVPGAGFLTAASPLSPGWPDAWPSGLSVRRVLRARAATFVRDHSRQDDPSGWPQARP